MDYESAALQQALTYWSEGLPIPLDLFAELLAEGYDVEALEEKHLADPSY
ncbi:TPA: hypothetical protein N2A14_002608 [Pseudomonas aeruginosa]|nr:hypothetical protein [Pseudomonas aeruginosa]